MPAATVPASEQTRAKSQSSAAEQRSEADRWLAKTRASLPQHTKRDFGTPPEMPTGLMSAQLTRDIDLLFGKNLEGKSWKPEQTEALARLASSKDPRVVWLLSDLMRIASDPRLLAVLTFAATNLLGVDLNPERHWGSTVDVLIAWDVPAPPGYFDAKRNIYTLVEPGWERIFAPGDIDWRHVSWGGVMIDARPYDHTNVPCNCIPAADNPQVLKAEAADWISEDAAVFGVSINGEHRAYPRSIMEVREMVNDTLGGRHIGIPYCTLCGSAQVYFTDGMPEGVERPVLRTSGLLIRSNKVMYDVNTYSVFDTFLGNAVTGPLAKRGIVLQQTGVVTTTWGEWKAQYPDTTVLDGWFGFGRDPDFRNTRDANGPIFPIGDVDPRLAVQEDVLGIVTAAGTPIAFHVKTAIEYLRRGGSIRVENVHVVLDGGGLRAVDANGADLGGHQAFWFAWSQFQPETRLWPVQ